jgi:hypothetical protein
MRIHCAKWHWLRRLNTPSKHFGFFDSIKCRAGNVTSTSRITKRLSRAAESVNRECGTETVIGVGSGVSERSKPAILTPGSEVNSDSKPAISIAGSGRQSSCLPWQPQIEAAVAVPLEPSSAILVARTFYSQDWRRCSANGASRRWPITSSGCCTW